MNGARSSRGCGDAQTPGPAAGRTRRFLRSSGSSKAERGPHVGCHHAALVSRPRRRPRTRGAAGCWPLRAAWARVAICWHRGESPQPCHRPPRASGTRQPALEAEPWTARERRIIGWFELEVAVKDHLVQPPHLSKALGWQGDLQLSRLRQPSGSTARHPPAACASACPPVLAPGLLLFPFYLPGASHLPGLPRTIGAGSN